MILMDLQTVRMVIVLQIHFVVCVRETHEAVVRPLIIVQVTLSVQQQCIQQIFVYVLL